MKKRIRLLIGLAALCVLGYSLYQIWTFGSEADASNKLNDALVSEAVTLKKPDNNVSGPLIPEETAPGEENAENVPMEAAPISVDFSLLREQSENIIGWLYSEDTQINLPVAQSGDNSYYLRRLLDGTGNNSGTLFADYRNARDFSDRNTVIYGHNMKTGTMFGTLANYKEQEYYDEHPYMWLLTEEGNFKVELIAGYVTPSTSDAYNTPITDEEALDMARTAVEKSTFVADVPLELGDRLLTLSTCSYEFDDARYVLIGKLVPAL